MIGGIVQLDYAAHVRDDSWVPDMQIPLHGQLLLADPSLRDGIFNRSVVLLNDHRSGAGASGLILNRPTGKVVGDFLKDDEFNGMKQLAVYEGGPVEPAQLTFSSFWWSKKLGLRWAMRISAEQVLQHCGKPGRIVRAFIGFSGWGDGQLEGELRRNSWITLAPTQDLLGQEHDRTLWANLLKNLSPLHRILAEAPDDPFLN